MQHKNDGWIIFVVIVFIVAAIFSIQAQTPITSLDRLDFVTAAGQTTFPTPPTSPHRVIVFRNGLLQTAGATADYTQMPIQNGTRIRITFNQPVGAALLVPNAGDRVTLFYY